MKSPLVDINSQNSSLSLLKLAADSGLDLDSLPVSWYHYNVDGKRLKLDSGVTERHVFTQDHGLVIIGVSEKDAGRYKV